MAKGKKTGGRKPGSRNKATAEIRDIIQRNVDFDVLTSKMMELVEGVTVRGSREDGTVYEIDKEPSVPAAKLLLEYGYGKPKEVIELDAGANTTEIVKMFATLVSAAGAGSATP